MRKIVYLTFGLGFLLHNYAHAKILSFGDNVPVEVRRQIQNTMLRFGEKVNHDFSLDQIKLSAETGLYEVVSGSNVFYVPAGGKYVLMGEIIDVGLERKNWNITDKTLNVVRKKVLENIDTKDMIVFKASNKKKPVGVVNVFTDIDCGYCQRFHKEVASLNDSGIEVRYIAFPRGGFDSSGYKKAVSVWCSGEQQKMLTAAKNRDEVPLAQCDNNPVAEQVSFGKKMGITGTPTLILQDGRKIPGYMKAEDLVKELTAKG